MEAADVKISVKLTKKDGEVSWYQKMNLRRFSRFCSLGSVARIDVRVTYPDGSWNEGGYTDAQEAKKALSAFLEK